MTLSLKILRGISPQVFNFRWSLADVDIADYRISTNVKMIVIAKYRGTPFAPFYFTSWSYLRRWNPSGDWVVYAVYFPDKKIECVLLSPSD